MPRGRRSATKVKGHARGGKNSGPPTSPATKKRGSIYNSSQVQGLPPLTDFTPAPPMIGHGGTIVASNPFDDSTPPSTAQVMPSVPTPSMTHMANNTQMCMPPVQMSSGKVYPSDQPMVFNPQNPNAPPIYPCGVCHKEVHDNDQAVLCESGCNFWFHRICTGLTETAFHLLTAEVYAEWVCDVCLSSKNIPLVKFKP